MMRRRTLATLLALSSLLAQPSQAESTIPNGVFVKNSEGLIWLVLNGQRVKIPVWTATDDEIAALPVSDRWAVMNDTGAIVAGDRPAWLDGQPIPISVEASPVARRQQEEPTAVSGRGNLNTRAFRLAAWAGGNYRITWTATADVAGTGCFVGGALRSVSEGGTSELLGPVQYEGRGPHRGETNIYHLPAGDYYVNMTSSCDWTVRIEPVYQL